MWVPFTPYFLFLKICLNKPTKNSKNPFGLFRSYEEEVDSKSRTRITSPIIFEERHSLYDEDHLSTDRTDRTWDRIHSRYGKLPEIPYEVDEDNIKTTEECDASLEDTDELYDVQFEPRHNIKYQSAVRPKLSLPATPTDPPIMRFMY